MHKCTIIAISCHMIHKLSNSGVSFYCLQVFIYLTCSLFIVFIKLLMIRQVSYFEKKEERGGVGGLILDDIRKRVNIQISP